MAKKNDTVKIDLISPIGEGDDQIKTVELREPKAGELRGLQLSLVQVQDMDTMMTLIPRISNLKERDLHNMKVADLTAVCLGVLGFFVNID